MSASNTLKTTIIVATTPAPRLGIGKNQTLPWPRLPSEMAYFARVTKRCPPNKRNAVIMGRKTWDSIPTNFRPLASRINVVISRTAHSSNSEKPSLDVDLENIKDEYWAQSLTDALALLKSFGDKVHRIYIIGGATIYNQALEDGIVDKILHTSVMDPDFDCDTFFSKIDETRWETTSVDELVDYTGEKREKVEGRKEENGVVFEFGMWRRKDDGVLKIQVRSP